ncbi:transcriptional regulator [Humidesulfovibrio sp.]|uniref:transcriptional regulator n=1 Tax=Humidesulfovibrio sp. TaxID=2910988 RepID=UPI002D7F1064|nr:transcriptional regulator [Humidesulfovibrio sp.]
MMSVTKLLILAICAFVVWKLFAGDKRWKQSKEQEKKEDLVASGEMVKDPVCGAYVSKNSDIRVRQGDVVLNFCSYDCREKYLKRLEGENGGGQA